MVTSTRSRATSLIALLAVVLLLATACGDDDGADASAEDGATTTTAAADDSATTTTAPSGEDPPSETDAANLRSDLVGFLEEQVYLTGYLVEEAVAGAEGLESPVAAAAVTAASESATDLSDLIGAGYGVAAGTDFLAAWNDHREAIVAHGLEDGPVEAVDSTRQAVLDTLAAMDPEADFSAVEDGLEASDAALTTTVEELAAGQPGAAADLRDAAEPMADVALSLATGITGRVETEGELESPEAELRSELTALMQESVMLTSIGLAETIHEGGDATAPSPAGVFEAVTENTDELADTIEPDDSVAAAEFARLWDGHIDDFIQYTTALVGDDAAGIEDAQESLVQFRDDLGEVLAETYPSFTKEQVAEELVDHTDSVLAFVDASVREAGDLADEVEETSEVEDAPAEAPGLLREAAGAARLAARTLTGGLTAPVAEAG